MKKLLIALLFFTATACFAKSNSLLPPNAKVVASIAGMNFIRFDDKNISCYVVFPAFRPNMIMQCVRRK